MNTNEPRPASICERSLPGAERRGSRDVPAGNVVPRSDTFTLGENVAPPSSDALNRTSQPRLSGCSRRSYHVTPTTPDWLTAISGMNWSVLSSGGLSLIQRARDHVLPPSVDEAKKIWLCPDRRSGQTTYSRSWKRPTLASIASAGSAFAFPNCAPFRSPPATYGSIGTLHPSDSP